jgi:dTDP-glucose pyrophosphorylase
LDWSLVSLANFREFELYLIARDLPGIQESLRASAEKVGFDKFRVVLVDHLTRGQAETACLATSSIEGDDSILIFNTDTFIDPMYLSPEMIRGDGWIPTFEAPGEQWSFVETHPDGSAIRTSEKVRISNHCSVGMYYFSSLREFCKLVEASNSDHELYVAPLYNEWIAAGRKTFIHELPEPAVTVLGTPADLERAGAQNRPTWPEFCR